jgi:hypothetical protein
MAEKKEAPPVTPTFQKVVRKFLATKPQPHKPHPKQKAASKPKKAKRK